MNRSDLVLIAATRGALADGSARARREAAGIRVAEMAAVCGASPAAVSMIERADPVSGRPLRVPGTGLPLAYGRALAEVERQAAGRRAALPGGDTIR